MPRRARALRVTLAGGDLAGDRGRGARPEGRARGRSHVSFTPMTTEPTADTPAAPTPADTRRCRSTTRSPSCSGRSAELEAGGQPLERTIALYERGVILHERCATLLADAEFRVQQLVARAGGALAAVDVRPEDADGGVARRDLA